MNFPLYSPNLTTATRYLFFSGKGGVGKTSLSCATALFLANAGRRVLLISTDPASNLDEVLQTRLTSAPLPVDGVTGLHALNISPLAAAAAYRERLIGPMRGLLPESALRSMEEQLSGSCTVEIAAFDEFTGLIGNPETTRHFDHLVFDTAPTGHTLRLMGLTQAWSQFISTASGHISCLGPLAGLSRQRAVYEQTLQTLVNPLTTTLYLVSRPQSSALREAERTSNELRALGMDNQYLILNGTFEAHGSSDATALSLQARGQAALQEAAPFISSLPTGYVPLRSINILGLTGLRSLLGENLFETALPPEKNLWMPPPMDSLQEMANAIESGGYGVVMTLGKGGVGKTTVAAALAILLARRGHTVHLSTTDPAAHLAETVSGPIQGLTVSRIDPRTETTFYRQQILKNQAATLDPASLAVLEEDLKSPCTEEIAVFRAFAREVSGGTSRFVVLDTAPTGHTLLLLDASESYTRELHRQSRGDSSESIVKLLERLRDPSFTRFLLVTLAEATPVHEALALQEDLRRAEIKPFGWIINQSLLNSGSSHPLLQGREQSEHRYIEEVMAQQPPRVAWIPWRLIEPIGSEALMAMAATKPILSSWIPPLVLP